MKKYKVNMDAGAKTYVQADVMQQSATGDWIFFRVPKVVGPIDITPNKPTGPQKVGPESIVYVARAFLSIELMEDE